MPGLVPGIHVFLVVQKDVDGRDKPGHDGECIQYRSMPLISTTCAQRAASRSM
jgi:hypothetical protein